jgi:1-acyl-sn-glycerol-3-phosphate acyltransferase
MMVTNHGKLYIFSYKVLQFLGILIFKILYRVEVINREIVPKEGRLILCSNHISFLDPVLMSIFFPRIIYFIAKKELFDIKILKNILSFYNAFPVKRGKLDMSVITTSIRVLKAEKVLGIYPEGTRSVTGDIKEGQRGVGLISHMGKAPILTMALSNTNKILQKPRKRIFFPKLKMIFGEIIKPEDFDFKNNKNLASSEMVNQVMISIKKLYMQIS